MRMTGTRASRPELPVSRRGVPPHSAILFARVVAGGRFDVRPQAFMFVGQVQSLAPRLALSICLHSPFTPRLRSGGSLSEVRHKTHSFRFCFRRQRAHPLI